jgi:hypothetical protein
MLPVSWRGEAKFMDKHDTILVSGYSRSPNDTSAHNQFDMMSISLLVETKTGLILAAEPTWSTGLGRKFMNDLLTGENINDMNKLIKLVDEHYFGRAKKAITNALITCCTVFEERFGAGFPVAGAGCAADNTGNR